MRNAKVFERKNLLLDFITQKDIRSTVITDPSPTVKVSDVRHYASQVESKNYPKTNIKNVVVNTIVQEQLPFRVKFVNKAFSSYGPGNPPPIGIAVIGVNNYIL